MKQTRRYELEGLILDIPLRYDEHCGRYIEEYPDFVSDPLWTPLGHPVMFAGEDACTDAEEAEPGGCPDCGSCRHYLRAAPQTLVGVCRHQARRNQQERIRRNE